MGGGFSISSWTTYYPIDLIWLCCVLVTVVTFQGGAIFIDVMPV